jgi:membrane protease YdiL (CAAX protease family)
LLIVYRLRSLWNAFWRVPRRRSPRVAWLMMLVAPVAYVSLFASAFVAARGVAGAREQAALLAVVCGAIVLSSGLTKMASSEAVIAGSGENEFLLTRPLALATLVVARSLAGAVTDFFDALFLLPVLLAASLAWRLGGAGIALAAVISVLAQVAVSAAAQAGQIAVVRFVRPPGRRAVWAALGLLAALAMAAVWVLGTQVVRVPAAVVGGLAGWADLCMWSPSGPLAAPLAALAAGDGAGAAFGLAVLVAGVGLVLGLAFLFARWAARDGWEHAGAPWAEAAASTSARGRAGPLTPFGKEILMLARDRSRLFALAVAPAVFVGIQIFGSAGWNWIAASPRHAAVLAFSLAAYLATYGPLGHMTSERRAFWLLCTSPFPLGRLMASKALFWAQVVGGMAALAYAGVLLLAPLPVDAASLGLGLVVVVGAATVACLAVAVGCGAADLSDDRRPAVGVGTVWMFMVTAGLFNAALLGDGQVRVRALLLFGLCVGLHWMTGIEQVALAYDPDSAARKRVLPGDGATLAILLYLGQQSTRFALGTATSADVHLGSAIWSAILLAAAGWALWRCPSFAARRGWLPSMIVAVVAGAAGASALSLRLPATPVDRQVVSLALGVLAEEVIFRGFVQRSLAERWLRHGTRGQVGALFISTVVALLAGARSLSPSALLVAATGAVIWAATGRLGAAVVARLLLEFLP